MIDPFTSWGRIVAASFEMARTGTRMVETISASAEVIASRSVTIRSAYRSPLDADYAELGRMMPEKVDAFSQAGSAIVDAWWAMGSAWLRETQNLASVSTRQRMPTLSELTSLSNRTAAYSLAAMEAGAGLSKKALAPIHRKATANARRLKRGAAKPGRRA